MIVNRRSLTRKMMKILVSLLLSSAICLSTVGRSGLGWDPNQPIRVGTTKGISLAGFPILTTKKFDRDFKVDIDIKYFTTGPVMNEALVAKQIEIGVAAELPTLTLYNVGAPVKTIAFYAYGGDRYPIIARTDTDIKKLADLAGKKVAVVLNSGPHEMLIAACRHEKVDISKIQLINMKNEDMSAALASKQLDAVVTWEPFGTFLLSQGFGRIVVRGGKYYGGYGMINMVREVIEKDEETAYRFVLAWAKAQQFLRKDSNLSEVVSILSRDWKFTEQEILGSLKYTKFDPRFKRWAYVMVDRTMEYGVTTGKFKEKLDLNNFWYSKLMQRAEKEHPELFSDLPAYLKAMNSEPLEFE